MRPHGSLRLALMLLLSSALACSGSSPIVAGSSVSPTPSREARSPEPTATGLPLPSCPEARRWVRFVSDDPALRFDAPVLSDTFGEDNRLDPKQGDWSGVAYQSGGGCRVGKWTFAGERFGGASLDFSDATERQVFLNHRWFVRDGETFVIQGGAKRLTYRVRPIETLEIGASRAVLFQASSMRPFFLEGDPADRDDELVAVINFPDGYHDVFASLSIHLIHRVTVDQLRRAVLSLVLTES